MEDDEYLAGREGLHIKLELPSDWFSLVRRYAEENFAKGGRINLSAAVTRLIEIGLEGAEDQASESR